MSIYFFYLFISISECFGSRAANNTAIHSNFIFLLNLFCAAMDTSFCGSQFYAGCITYKYLKNT